MGQDNRQGFSIFLTGWIGQTVSAVGSMMTTFALTLWIWEQTGRATDLALVGFFDVISRASASLVGGVVADNVDRKTIIIAADIVAGISSIAILLIFLGGNLEIWHLYVSTVLNAIFSEFQMRAFVPIISVLMPKKEYTRASAMMYITGYAPSIISPAVVGVLYPIIDLSGVIAIDIATFIFAVVTIAVLTVPMPAQTDAGRRAAGSFWHQVRFSFAYLWQKPGLRMLTITGVLFWFFHDITSALYNPMVLARTGGSEKALAAVSAAAGIAGVTSAVLTSVTGGPRNRVAGSQAGMVGAGIAKTIFGLGRGLGVWIPAQLGSSVNFPVMGASRQGIFLSKIEHDIQGRVMAVNKVIITLFASLAYLVAGPLADRVIEPAMQDGGALTGALGGIFGVGPGAGLSVIYSVAALMLIVVGVGGYANRSLRQIETDLPDVE